MAKDKDILSEAKDAFDECANSRQATENREAWLDDFRFARLNQQWPAEVEQDRIRDGRPALTFNRLPTIIRQVVNDARQNRPAIKTSPADDQADLDTAKVFNGLIRHIEHNSDADVAYDHALDCAVSGGFGYFRINLEYATDDGFDKDIVIRRIADPMSVFEDPYAMSADSSEWNTAFVVESIPLKRFEKQYRGAQAVDFDAAAYEGLKGTSWRDGDTVLRAEYWRRDEVTKRILAIAAASDIAIPGMDPFKVGQAVMEDVYKEHKALFDAMGAQVIGEGREVKSHKVTQYILTGAEVLDTIEWAGRYIPIIPVYGEEVIVEGQRHFRSLIRDARGAQEMYNVSRNAQIEREAMSPKTPWIGPKGAFTTDAYKWATANTDNHAYIEFDTKDEDGNQLPTAPQRQFPEPPNAAAIQLAMQAADDIKTITGIYDASLGARGNETSGRAIIARQRQGDVSTFHFIDNLARSIRHAGRILIDLIPTIYTQDRIVRVMGPDGASEVIPLGQPVPVMGPDGQPVVDQETKQPRTRVYDLSVGKYDLTVDVGPSFNTKREEAANQMIEMIRAYPAIAPLIGDLLAKNLDWPGADEIAERLKAMLPPQLQGKDPRIEQMAQQLTQLGQALQQSQAQIKGMEQDRSIEVAKVQIERGKLELERKKAGFQVQNDTRQTDIDAMNAETTRAKAVIGPKGVGLGLTPEIQALVMDTMAQALNSPDLLQPPQPQPAPMVAAEPADQFRFGA